MTAFGQDANYSIIIQGWENEGGTADPNQMKLFDINKDGSIDYEPDNEPNNESSQ